MEPDSTTTWRTAATFSRGVRRIPHLPALLGAERVAFRPRAREAAHIDVVIGWGQKGNTAAAHAFARRHEIPYWRAEDGFLRSVGIGVEGHPPLSIVLDDLGIYYDATGPSRLEAMLLGDERLEESALIARARAAIDRITSARLSKYNHSPPDSVELPPRSSARVLVVDQTAGDLSIGRGMATSTSFTTMLDAALAEHPDAEIIIKIHPDVLAGKKRGHLNHVLRRDRVRVVAAPCNPIELIEQVDHVYVVTSQMGFEALMLGKPVTVFGAPFYAGWGLTDDRLDIPRRGRSRSIEQLFAAAYILYPRYVDPDTGEPCSIERVINHLALQRARFADNAGRIYCFGFQFWKRNWARAYMRSPGNRILFPRTARDAERRGFDREARIVIWGQREPVAVRELAARHEVPVWRMEDGFLRSVGLGSDLAAPASLVVDREGVYYDPRGPSELESILQTATFTDQLLGRARALRERIVSTELSKYNLGTELTARIPEDKRVILVPGQVEDDASIQLGCRDVRTNLGLLTEARRQNPAAFIIYKPHPDVVSGNRRGKLALEQARAHCDHIEREAALPRCLAVADEVHTLTSLVGFEALLREIPVVVFGQPFYSGWGLTRDRHPMSRRTRKLGLDELVAGALLLYPRYVNRHTGQFTTPEVIIQQLSEERDQNRARAVKVAWPRRQLRKLIGAYRGVMHAP